MVHANGTVEALRWPGDALELVIPLESRHSDSMAVLPDMKTDLDLRLEFQPAFLFSSDEGLRVRNVLVGRAEASQPQTLGAPMP